MIDYQYYQSLGLTEVDENEFIGLELQASEVVDAITFRAFERYDLADTPLGEKAKKAVALLISHIVEIGSIDVWAEGVKASESIGNYSYTLVQGQKPTFNGLSLPAVLPSLLSPIIALGRRIG